MNIKEYISSGVVESYVLGLLTAEERFEFEKYCEAYPELKEARTAFELAIEKQAMQNSIAPPADLKQKIASKIFDENKTAYLHVAETNFDAIMLYEKLGFKTRRSMSFWDLEARPDN